MSRLKLFYDSTVGKKIIMAATGLAMVGFVVGHMLGNLKIFAGKDEHGVHAIDHYAEFLHTIGEDFLGHETFLWLVRVGLLLVAVLHVVMAIQLTARNRGASPGKYVGTKYRSSTIASRTMAYGGLFLAVFIIFHILHFTTGTLHSNYVYGQVHANVTHSFSYFLPVIFYVAAMVALGLHMYHGVWSMFQTLGVDSASLNPILRLSAKGLAVVLFLGFSAVPLLIYLVPSMFKG